MTKPRFFLIAYAALTFVGCSDSGPFKYIPVSGRLTYEDGAPLPAGGIRLGFKTLDAQPVGNAFPRPAEAVVNAEGNFESVTSYKPDDGLIPGKHKVTLYYATDKQGKLLVPKEYADPSTTPLIIDTASLPLEIKVPRP